MYGLLQKDSNLGFFFCKYHLVFELISLRLHSSRLEASYLQHNRPLGNLAWLHRRNGRGRSHRQRYPRVWWLGLYYRGSFRKFSVISTLRLHVAL